MTQDRSHSVVHAAGREAGDHGECVGAICEIEKSVTLRSPAFDLSRDADRIGAPEGQCQSVKLLVAEMAGDISYIDFHDDTRSFLEGDHRTTIHPITAM